MTIKSIYLNFQLETLKPNKLVKDKRGILFYADDKGNLKEIAYDHSLMKHKDSNITTKINRFNQNIREFFKNMTSNVSKSVLYCGKTIVNFGISFFAKDAQNTLLEYDC